MLGRESAEVKSQGNGKDTEDERGRADEVDEGHQPDHGEDEQQHAKENRCGSRRRQQPAARQDMAQPDGGCDLERAANERPRSTMMASSSASVTPGQTQAVMPATSPLAPATTSDQSCSPARRAAMPVVSAIAPSTTA